MGLSTIAQVIEIERTVVEKGEVTRERSYFLCSRSRDTALPEQLLALIRDHLSIEARHFVRDVTFREDHSRIRTGHAPQILAAICNALITLLGRAGHTTYACARRHFAANPSAAFALLRRHFPLRRVPA